MAQKKCIITPQMFITWDLRLYKEQMSPLSIGLWKKLFWSLEFGISVITILFCLEPEVTRLLPKTSASILLWMQGKCLVWPSTYYIIACHMVVFYNTHASKIICLFWPIILWEAEDTSCWLSCCESTDRWQRIGGIPFLFTSRFVKQNVTNVQGQSSRNNVMKK